MQDARIGEILSFWRTAGPEKWFKKDPDFDAEIALRFMPTYDAAARGECDDWTEDAEGALALLILLDQMPRNMFRGLSRAFATDEKARAIAREAILAGVDQLFPAEDRQFFYLPFMHSEVIGDQETSVKLYQSLGLDEQLKYAVIHHEVVARFGRFPHRNAVLGRDTTPEEAAYLANGGFSA